VVVAFGNPHQLDSCLAAIGQNFDLVVVDNSSSADVHAIAEAHGARYVDSGRNRGFAAGVNVALEPLLAGEPRDVLLLNPDASLRAEDVTRLANCLHEARNRNVAAISPRLIDPEGGDQRVVWPFPSPRRAWGEAIGLTEPRACGGTFVIGAALLLRWEALRVVGLFDERFFLYAEETDWQRRAFALGWRSLLCVDVVGVHAGGGASDDTAHREVLFHAAQETYIRKWYGSGGWWTYRAAALVGATARAILLRGDRRAAAARRALLYARGPRQRAGFTTVV
jgi:GT2 family glycosyltransferase